MGFGSWKYIEEKRRRKTEKRRFRMSGILWRRRSSSSSGLRRFHCKSRNRTWRICKITTEITSFMGLSGHWRLVITKLSNPRITPKGKIARYSQVPSLSLFFRGPEKFDGARDTRYFLFYKTENDLSMRFERYKTSPWRCFLFPSLKINRLIRKRI